MAQPHSAEKGYKPLLHLTYSIHGLAAQKDFCFSQQCSAVLQVKECLQVWTR